MSLTSAISGGVNTGFPRVSGDEPLTGLKTLDSCMFSPRERG